jgi:PEP-CTERM putative exosortase interaction domain
MNTHDPSSLLRGAVLAAFASGLLASSASAGILFDDFDGGAVDGAVWAVRSTSGSATVGDGAITFALASTSTSQRSLVVSRAMDFNPFAEKLTISFGGLVLGGSSAEDQPNWGNTFYAGVGRASVDTGGELTTTVLNGYSNVGNGYESALGLNVRRSDTAVILAIIDRNSENHTTTNLTLSGVPTDVVWEIDGAAKTWSITLTGATFSDSGDASATGSFYRFNETGLLVSEDIVSRLFFGAINVGNLVDPTTVTLDSVGVGAIPEPAGAALLASGLVGAAVITRRRRG